MNKEISGEAMSETFEQLLERWDRYMAKSYYISLSDQKIIHTQLAAMRDELERYKDAANYWLKCHQVDVEVVNTLNDQLRTQLADQSARMASLEAQAGAIKSIVVVGLKAGLAAARSCQLNTTYHKRVIGEALTAIESSQAGADLLQRVQALEADKRRLEPRFDSLVLRCNRCKRLFYACMIRALRDADTFRDIASMLTAGATVELLEDKQELKRSEFGCKCEPAEYAALSQEQATTRNV